MMKLGRPKGGKNRTWTSKEKYDVILPIINGEISKRDRVKELGLALGMIGNWIAAYNRGGIEALENKRKPGNPLQKYQAKKELSYTEQLEYENMKLRIENERLKKGYTSKEADLAKQKKSSKRNMK
jgi:transposase